MGQRQGCVLGVGGHCLSRAGAGIAKAILLESACVGSGGTSIGVGGSCLVGDGPSAAKRLEGKMDSLEKSRRRGGPGRDSLDWCWGTGCGDAKYCGGVSPEHRSARESKQRGFISGDARKLCRKGKRRRSRCEGQMAQLRSSRYFRSADRGQERD